ncbi:MAG TPA: hypothetical protein VKG45_02935 [Actinomycetes bacterium]|nr:hypothetical protein [Actinomycetes bacterium]
MAGAFGADPQVAVEVSRELAGIRTDMGAVGGLLDGYRGTTGSRRVAAALGAFHADSSDSREQMDRLLERASGLLQGLAEGTIAVDTGLAGSLEPEEGQRPAAAMRARPVAGGGGL